MILSCLQGETELSLHSQDRLGLEARSHPSLQPLPPTAGKPSSGRRKEGEDRTPAPQPFSPGSRLRAGLPPAATQMHTRGDTPKFRGRGLVGRTLGSVQGEPIKAPVLVTQLIRCFALYTVLVSILKVVVNYHPYPQHGARGRAWGQVGLCHPPKQTPRSEGGTGGVSVLVPPASRMADRRAGSCRLGKN